MLQRRSSVDPVALPRGPAVLRVLLLLSWLVPLLVLAAAGLWTWQVELQEAEGQVKATLRVIEEHIHDILAADTLVLDWMADRTAGMSWDEIEHSRPLYELMDAVDRNHEQLSAVFMVDSTGRMRINDHEFPLKQPIQLDDRDYFRALATGTRSLFIGEPAIGRRSNVFAFRIARPRRKADGTFDGLIAVAVRIETIQRFFQSVVGPTGNSVTLLRQDGVMLARYPQVPASRQIALRQLVPEFIEPGSSEKGPFVSPVDGIRRLVGIARLGDYPVIVTYGIDYSFIFAQWLTNFLLCGSVALASALVLSAVTFLAIRGQRRESAAVAAWQDEQMKRRAAEADAIRMGKYEALGTLAGGIAHHFNNLLPALTGHLDMAMQEVGDSNPARPRLQRLLQELDGARRIIRNILLFSRRDISAFRPVDLSEVAGRCIEMFQATLGAETELKTDIAQSVQVFGDASQLSELITNLLSNARDAVEELAGAIRLSVGPARTEAGDVDDRYYARIVCSDNGVGMSPSVIERAFDPFFTTKLAGRSAGLGLAICDGIVRAHGGRMTVDSVVGRGSRFTVWLPLAQREG